ncbi:unnamed protein product [Urochloa humidicola]
MPRVGHSSPASHRHCSPVLTTARRRTATCSPSTLSSPLQSPSRGRRCGARGVREVLNIRSSGRHRQGALEQQKT